MAPRTLSWSATVGVLAGLAGVWLAGGSAGLLAHSLRNALTWVAVGLAAIFGQSGRRCGWAHVLSLVAAAAVVVAVGSTNLTPATVMAVAGVLAVLAAGRTDGGGWAFRLAAAGAGVLGVHRVAICAIPTWWLAADSIGEWLGCAGGFFARRRLWVGSTFAALDCLILMGVLWLGWVLIGPRPRWRRGAIGAAAIVAAHLAYLIALSHLASVVAPEAPAAPAARTAQVRPDAAAKAWTWTQHLAAFVAQNVSNLPAVACAVHLLLAGFIFRWTSMPEAAAPAPAAPRDAGRRPEGPLAPLGQATAPILVGWIGCLLLAVLVPATGYLALGPCSLQGRKVVAYKKGFLNWNKPEHGQYGRLAGGMYGMWDQHVRSLGGEFVISEWLSKEDMSGADVLILFYPNEPWLEGQLERIEGFVRGGGRLLVLGEHTVKEELGKKRNLYALPTSEPTTALRVERGPEEINYFNQVLHPTRMRVRFDSATFHVGGWLNSYQALAHPATLGIRDDRNQFGAVIGASVEARWPARPLLVGLWGWNDPGEEIAGDSIMGNHRYDPGERLGDIVLAAEQPLGKGAVVAFGDTSGFTNQIMVGSHVFVHRLLGYLGSYPGGPQALWRQVAGIALAVVLAVMLAASGSPARSAVTAMVLAGCLVACVRISHRANEVLPDGARVPVREQAAEGPAGKAPGAATRPSTSPAAEPLPPLNGLAYIDTSHLEAFSEEGWRDDGAMGLAVTLMRNGYLVLSLPEFTERRIRGAGLLVSVAPSREFAAGEREVLRRWVADGGIFICTAGYPERAGSRRMLRDFGFEIGTAVSSDDREAPDPVPMGHFKSPYIENEGYRAHVRFHAAWPVACSASDDEKRIIAYGRGELPVIIMRRYGRGRVAVIGDTGFAMCKNLEREYGQAFEGMRENADFWRWFLTVLTDRPMWIPPPPKAVAEPAGRPPARPAATQAAAPQPTQPAQPEQPDAPDEPEQDGQEGAS